MADSFADMPATVAPTLPLTFVDSALQDRPLRRTRGVLKEEHRRVEGRDSIPGPPQGLFALAVAVVSLFMCV